MPEEINALHKSDTYELAENQKGKTPLKTKWVYRLKHEENGQLPCKARLVVNY